MTSTYNMALLDTIQSEEIVQEIQRVMQVLEDVKDSDFWSNDIHSALTDRLSHRVSLLSSFSLGVEDYQSYNDNPLRPWETCLDFSSKIETTHTSGKPVEEAFSTNVQRKLASTVPPRPKVEMPFGAALENLRRMCQEMTEVMKIVQYVSPGNILVRTYLHRF